MNSVTERDRPLWSHFRDTFKHVYKLFFSGHHWGGYVARKSWAARARQANKNAFNLPALKLHRPWYPPSTSLPPLPNASSFFNFEKRIPPPNVPQLPLQRATLVPNFNAGELYLQGVASSTHLCLLGEHCQGLIVPLLQRLARRCKSETIRPKMSQNNDTERVSNIQSRAPACLSRRSRSCFSCLAARARCSCFAEHVCVSVLQLCKK